MFLWYIEFAAKDRQHGITSVPDSEGWQARLIAEATAAAMPQKPEPDRSKPTPPLKRAG